MRKSIFMICIVFLCYSFLFYTDNGYATSRPYVEGGSNCDSATLLTNQDSYVKLVPEQYWNDMGEMWANFNICFKFIPIETGEYTLTVNGSGESMPYDFAVQNSEKNNIAYKNCEYDQSYPVVFNVEEGVTYFIKINISTNNKTYYTLNFDKPIYAPMILNYTAGTGGSITGQVAQTISSGENGTEVTAVPDAGYIFSQWSDGVTTATRTDENVTSNIAVTAEFVLDPNTISIDTAWTGSTLQLKITSLLDGKALTDVKTLNITAGELTDDDVMFISRELINLENLNITGSTSFINNKLPDYAFSKTFLSYENGGSTNLQKLKSITIDLDDDESLSFGEGAFQECYVLTDVNLQQVVSFEDYAFMYCRALKNVNLPEAVTFGKSAFSRCTFLEKITIPRAEKFGGGVFYQCENLIEVHLPEAIIFSDYAFDKCYKLKNIELPKATTFGSHLFGEYVPLEKIDLPKAETIGDNAFYLCNLLKTVNLPQLTTIGSDAFKQCNNSITLNLGSTPPAISNTFTSYITAYRPGDWETPKLIVPEEAEDAYKKSEGWSDGLWYGWSLGEDSNDNTLSGLTVDENSILGFEADKIEYDLGSTTKTSIAIGATANDSNASVTGDIGQKEILIGPNTFTITVTAQDNSIKEYTLTIVRDAIDDSSNSSGSSSSSGSHSSHSHSSSSTTTNTVEGVTDTNSFSAGTKETTNNNEGKTETVVRINESAIKAEADKIEKGETISIPVSGDMNVFKTNLSIQSIEDMQRKDVVLEVKTDEVVYALNTEAVDVKGILDVIGKNVTAKDIPFTIEISKTNKEMVKVVEDSAFKSGLSIIAPSIDFKVKASYKDKTYDVDNFNSFVTRAIAIPSNVDAEKITTAVITEADGSIRHVPTYVTKINGKYFAKINSLTNSTYTLIHNEAKFSDIKDNYWAKTDIEKMASRLIVQGQEDGTFLPKQAITRKELAQVLVKALGLHPIEVNKFVDVEKGSKYAGYIGTAYSYGIINGTSKTTFNPEAIVTRQDAMTMIYRAGLIAEMKNNNNKTEMTKYLDYKTVSVYAKEAVEWNVNNSIVKGKTDTTLAPRDNITRSELSVIINRLLIASGLIE